MIDQQWVGAGLAGVAGEDGFEISIPGENAVRVAQELLGASEVEAIGLGARDSLRLEAGLCLYGADIDATTTPAEAALEWVIQKSRRTGGARAGGFPGADRILGELERPAARRRVGIEVEGRAPVRAGASLFLDAQGSNPVGRVTSGLFGPSINASVAMGYVAAAHAAPGTAVQLIVRDQPRPAVVAAMPFAPHRYHRA